MLSVFSKKKKSENCGVHLHSAHLNLYFAELLFASIAAVYFLGYVSYSFAHLEAEFLVHFFSTNFKSSCCLSTLCLNLKTFCFIS